MIHCATGPMGESRSMHELLHQLQAMSGIPERMPMQNLFPLSCISRNVSGELFALFGDATCRGGQVNKSIVRTAHIVVGAFEFFLKGLHAMKAHQLRDASASFAARWE